jgi:hypothetical protein
VNPRIGSGLKYGSRVEEENRRGGEKPRGRHAGGDWRPRLEGARKRRGNAVRRPPGVGLRGLNDGRAIFGQPQERKPGFTAGSQGLVSVGKVGAKVRRVAHIYTEVWVSGPVEGPRGPECGDALQGRGGQQ